MPITKKLLIYRWGSLNEPMLCEAVRQLQKEYVAFSGEMNNYHGDAAFAGRFMETLHGNEVGAVISYDYFPLISMICEINHIPYLSWIYDCPQYTLLSKTLANSCNYIFCFDRVYAQRLVQMGAVHCFHYPLAAWEGFFNPGKEGETFPGNEKYQCDISFVGNLYNEKKNRLRRAELTPYIKGYVEGLARSQMLVYGYNFLRDSLTEGAVNEIVEKCGLSLGNEYRQDQWQMAADAIGMEVSAMEREQALCRIGDEYPIMLYTSSGLPPSFNGRKIQKMGYADYQKEVPFIFHNSRINLNITSKTIESGIPQRAFDILSCGGFCLTNYQPEIAEYFADGEELAMYTDMDDLFYKVGYYLQHEEERAQIALNGYQKAVEEFGLKKRVEGMLGCVRG